MSTDVVASSNALLTGLPSVVQGLLVLALVGVVTAREVTRHGHHAPQATARLDRAGRLLIPLVLMVLGVRLLVILL